MADLGYQPRQGRNLFFQRRDNGSVVLRKYKDGVKEPGKSDLEMELVFKQDEWANIMLHVSSGINSHERFYEALHFHGRVNTIDNDGGIVEQDVK